MSVKSLAVLTCVALLLSPAAGRSQPEDKVYRTVPPAVLEDILQDLNVRFKKTSGKEAGTYFYDYERNNYKIRLHTFAGRDLMLDAIFGSTTVDRINQWNIRAKFSRGVLYPGNGKPYASVESNLDCVGGVTLGAIKQFIRRFDGEVRDFDNLLASGGGTGAAPAGPQTETVFTNVSGNLLETILRGLNISYNKTADNNGRTSYDYDRNNFRIRLINFGGGDLMLSGQFRKATLEEVNNYNLKSKFVRAVLYPGNNGQQYTALEANLDCGGGVTENILRDFITTFDIEMKEFNKYLTK
jgi:hypothetical protein